MTGLHEGGVFGTADDDVSRRNVRHALMRAHNRRVGELRDDRWPLALHACRRTVDELLLDGDPAEAQTVDSLGMRFLGIPLEVDPRLAAGEFTVVWPPTPVPPKGSLEQPPGLFEVQP